jgi:hypothetical protein
MPNTKRTITAPRLAALETVSKKRLAAELNLLRVENAFLERVANRRRTKASRRLVA